MSGHRRVRSRHHCLCHQRQWYWLHRGNTHLQLLDDRGLGGLLLVETRCSRPAWALMRSSGITIYQILIPGSPQGVRNAGRMAGPMADWFRRRECRGPDPRTHPTVRGVAVEDFHSRSSTRSRSRATPQRAMDQRHPHRLIPGQENQWRPWHEVNPRPRKSPSATTGSPMAPASTWSPHRLQRPHPMDGKQRQPPLSWP